MGGDGQPQILLQLLTRLLLHRQSPAQAIAAGRWLLRGTTSGFDTWTGARQVVQVEGHAPAPWVEGLGQLGHAVERLGPFEGSFGHAHVILTDGHGMLAGAADPRSLVGSCAAT
jgi:gamma-glutamyltranspeptidase/glutathione hydrolase